MSALARTALAPPFAPPRAGRQHARRCRCATRAAAAAAPRVVLVPTARCVSLARAVELSLPSFVVGSGADAHVRVENDANGVLPCARRRGDPPG
jgi:hypothetical protein